jgi:hypothetical protein
LPRKSKRDKVQCHIEKGLRSPCAGLALENSPDLSAVVDAWPMLPEAIRAGILAMVKAASGQGGGG